jgi:hypothetical protein
VTLDPLDLRAAIILAISLLSMGAILLPIAWIDMRRQRARTEAALASIARMRQRSTPRLVVDNTRRHRA